MSNPVRSSLRKSVDGLLDAVAAPLDEVAHNKVAGAIESVVAVNANHIIFAPVRLRRRPLLLILAHFIYEIDKACHFDVGGRYLRHCREFVILDVIAKAFRVIYRIGMTDVDNVLDLISPNDN